MKLHQYYKYFIIFISILEVLQVIHFLHASLFFQLLTLAVNFNFSHHLKFMMPSWKRENMQLKNGKVKMEFILIVTHFLKWGNLTLFDSSLSKGGVETLQPLSSLFPLPSRYRT